MTCTHDAEEFLAAASLALQHGEDLMCSPQLQRDHQVAIDGKRMAPCHYCRVQQSLWAFKLLVHPPVCLHCCSAVLILLCSLFVFLVLCFQPLNRCT